MSNWKCKEDTGKDDFKRVAMKRKARESYDNNYLFKREIKDIWLYLLLILIFETENKD